MTNGRCGSAGEEPIVYRLTAGGAGAYNIAKRQPREHQGPLIWATLRVLRALFWWFHGADGGGRGFLPGIAGEDGTARNALQREHPIAGALLSTTERAGLGRRLDQQPTRAAYGAELEATPRMPL